MPDQLPPRLSPYNPNNESPTDQYYRKMLERDKLVKNIMMVVLVVVPVCSCLVFCVFVFITLVPVAWMGINLPSWIQQFTNPNFHW
jgi:ABC-type anion transport system duplicated permease subunit